MSSGRNPQPPPHSASFQSTSAHNPNQIVSKLSEDTQKLIHAAELLSILANLKVVTPHELLSESFPNKKEWDRVPCDTIKQAFKDELAHYDLNFTENKLFYECLQRAFDTCCDGVTPVDSVDDYVPKNNLHCANTSQLRPRTENLSGDPAKRAPDLCLTFDTMENYSPSTFYSLAMVTLEFKSKVNADPGFTAIAFADSLKIKEQKTDDKAEMLSIDASKILAQAFGYVFAQWAERPYRHIWSITIARNILRIWKWSASGVVVTEAVDYISDATPVYQFLQAIGKGPYSRLGLDVGHGMTFGPIERREVRWKVHSIIKDYGHANNRTQGYKEWVTKALESDIWSFGQSPSIRIQNGILAVQNPQAPTHKGKARAGKTDVTSQSANYEAHKDAAGMDTLYVVSHPIWCGKGISSRGTRCYLALSEAMLIQEDDLTIKDAHMLKTSWQFSFRSAEYQFFNHVQYKNSGPLPRLASMIAGGSIESTKQQKRGQNPAEGDSTALEWTEDPKGRHIQWILFKQVGERISGFRSAKELLQIIYDAVEAHENLYKAGVLHGDISENNVLIDLSADRGKGISTRRGLLIDLDMARFVDEEELHPADSRVTDDLEIYPDSEDYSESESNTNPEPDPSSGGKPRSRPDLTGTLLFMSIAKKSQPLHQCWHDMESFYWLLLFVTLRHVRRVVVVTDTDTYHLDDATEREQILQLIFHPPPHKNALSDFSKAKEDFLKSNAKLTVEGNRAFTILMNQLYAKLRAQYSVLKTSARLATDLQHIANALNGRKISVPLEHVYMASGPRQCREQLVALSVAFEKISATLKRLMNAEATTQTVSSLGDGQLTKRELAARERVQKLNLPNGASGDLRDDLVEWRRNMELHRDSSQDLAFLTHEWLKNELLKAIAKQDAIPPVPSQPFHPKPVENAVRTIQSGVSRIIGSESGSTDVSYRIDHSASASASGGSRGASSVELEQAGQKRKRSADVAQSSAKEKRQKKMHQGKGSSGSSDAKPQ